MKKLAIFLGIIMLFMSCNPTKWFKERYRWTWAVDNYSGQNLKLEYPYYSSDENCWEYRTCELVDGGLYISVNLHYVSTYEEMIAFDYYFNESANYLGNDVCWRILSEEGAVLKTWRYSDRNKSGQRFFDESSWIYGKGFAEWLEVPLVWTFGIYPEDIAQN